MHTICCAFHFKVAGEVQGEAISLSDVADASRIEWYKKQGLEITAVQSTQPLSEVHPDAHATISRSQALPTSNQNPSVDPTGLAAASTPGQSSQNEDDGGLSVQVSPVVGTQSGNTAGGQENVEGMSGASNPGPPSEEVLTGAIKQVPSSNSGALRTKQENTSSPMTVEDRSGQPIVQATQTQKFIQHQSAMPSGSVHVPASGSVPVPASGSVPVGGSAAPLGQQRVR